MIGLLRLVAALCCAAALSQFPAFSDQYVQRLGGRVDALQQVAADFEASARDAGLTRAEALADLSGSAFRQAHQSDMRRVFRRLDNARADLTMLRIAGPLERMLLPHRLRDAETLRNTWQDFRPALPITAAGLICAAIGFLFGWLLLSLVRLTLRRRPEPLGWR
jgi:hypothetical protein